MLSFGWQRGQTLGGFFNGVFLLALGLTIFMQSIERLIEHKREQFTRILDVRLLEKLIRTACVHRCP